MLLCWCHFRVHTTSSQPWKGLRQPGPFISSRWGRQASSGAASCSAGTAETLHNDGQYLRCWSSTRTPSRAHVPKLSSQLSHCPLQAMKGNPETDKKTWNVQFFRSISETSAKGLPRSTDATKMGLTSQKGKVVEFSIQVRHKGVEPCPYPEVVESSAFRWDKETKHLVPLRAQQGV